MTKLITGLQEVADAYDAFVFDIWGVVHNGVAVYETVNPCLEQLHAKGKTLALLTNSPRRAEGVVPKLTTLGLNVSFNLIAHSSGEQVCIEIAKRQQEGLWGHKCYAIGHEAAPIIETLQLTNTSLPEAADFILITGLDHRGTNMEAYKEDLALAVAHNVPLICANPDKLVYKGAQQVPCAGAVAAEYEAMGGTVHYFGKPYEIIYHYLATLLPKNARVLAVGDSLTTDIPGALQFGWDSALTATGIHQQQLQIFNQSTVDSLCMTYDVTPTFAVPGLLW